MLDTVLSTTKMSNSQFCPEEDQHPLEQMDQKRSQGSTAWSCEVNSDGHNTEKFQMDAQEDFQRP